MASGDQQGHCAAELLQVLHADSGLPSCGHSSEAGCGCERVCVGQEQHCDAALPELPLTSLQGAHDRSGLFLCLDEQAAWMSRLHR